MTVDKARKEQAVTSASPPNGHHT